MVLDILITHGFAITMVGAGTGIITNAAVGIKGNKIAVVGPVNEVLPQYTAHRYIDARNKVIMPGLIDAHIHPSDTIVRGAAQDITNWFQKGIWPVLNHADEEDMVNGSMVNLIEAVKAGTTTFCDYDNVMHLSVENHVALGTRVIAAPLVNDLPPGFVKLPSSEVIEFDPAIGEQKLKNNVFLVEKYHGMDNGRITCMFGPQATDMCSLELLRECYSLAQKYNVGIHMHVAQSKREDTQMEMRYGKRTIPFLEEQGMLVPNMLAAHMTCATEEELVTVARSGVSMVLCTNSIAILGGAIPPAQTFMKYSDRLALGSDQSPGNNCNNMFNEMKFTSILHKVKNNDPTVFPAWKVLRMATIENARAIGLGDKIGSLEPGKYADVILIDLETPALSPMLLSPIRNIVPNLVYSANGSEVNTVIINGKVVMENRRMLTVDEIQAINKLNHSARKICEKLAAQPDISSLPVAKWTEQGYY